MSLSLLFPSVLKIIDKIIPDPTEKAKAKNELMALEQNGELRKIEAGASIVQAEAKGESWLQRNWRPVTMLTFVALVVAKWLGFTDSGVSQEVELELMELIKLGITGYVVGRSVEKGVKVWKSK